MATATRFQRGLAKASDYLGSIGDSIGEFGTKTSGFLGRVGDRIGAAGVRAMDPLGRVGNSIGAAGGKAMERLGKIGDRIGAAGGRFAAAGGESMQRKFSGLGPAPDFPLAHPTPAATPRQQAQRPINWGAFGNSVLSASTGGLTTGKIARMARGVRDFVQDGLRKTPPPQPAPAPQAAPAPQPEPDHAFPEGDEISRDAATMRERYSAAGDVSGLRTSPEKGIYHDEQAWKDYFTGPGYEEDRRRIQWNANRAAANEEARKYAGWGVKLGETSGAEAAAYAAAHPGLRTGSGVFGRNDREAHMQRNRDFIASGRGSHFQARPASSRGRNMEELRGLKRYELESARRADAMRARNDSDKDRMMYDLKKGELGATVENNRQMARNDAARIRNASVESTRNWIGNILQINADAAAKMSAKQKQDAVGNLLQRRDFVEALTQDPYIQRMKQMGQRRDESDIDFYTRYLTDNPEIWGGAKGESQGQQAVVPDDFFAPGQPEEQEPALRGTRPPGWNPYFGR